MGSLRCGRCGVMYNDIESRCPQCGAPNYRMNNEATKTLPDGGYSGIGSPMGSVPPPYNQPPQRYARQPQRPVMPPPPPPHRQVSHKNNGSDGKVWIYVVMSVVILALLGVIVYLIIDDRGDRSDARMEEIVTVATLGNPRWSADVTENEKSTIRGLLNEMVDVGGFHISKFEITQSQWEAVMGTSVYGQSAKHGGARMTGVNDRFPMYYVNQREADEFCRELSRKTGLNFNLPTESQWENAARAGGRENYTYSGADYIYSVAWFGEDHNTGQLHKVGSLSPNGLGIYDMSGNVWEWCRETALIKGGCIMHDESKCRISWRWSEPNYHKGFNRGGFRIVME